jgi:hypothetical protein
VICVSHLLGGSKEHFSFALSNSLVCFLFLLSLKVLVWLLSFDYFRFDFLFSLIRVLLGK